MNMLRPDHVGRFALALSLLALGPMAASESPRIEPFPLASVRLLDGPFLDAQQRGLESLLRLEPQRLLHTFRLNAGLPTTASPYGGWEAPTVELRGHSLGHYLTACALMYEATGDARLKDRALAIVGELRKVQQTLPSLGMSPGYLSAFPEELFDRVEARKPVWAPYYTLHKIMAGLLDVHRVTGDPTALEAVEYAIPRGLTEGRETIRVTFRTEPAGATGAVFDVRLVRPRVLVGR